MDNRTTEMLPQVFVCFFFLFLSQLVLHLVGLSLISIWHSLVQKEKKIMAVESEFYFLNYILRNDFWTVHVSLKIEQYPKISEFLLHRWKLLSLSITIKA